MAIALVVALSSAGVPIVPSEVAVPLGGALASQGRLGGFGAVVAAAVAGDLTGSVLAFLLARRYGEAVILGPGRRIGLSSGHMRLAERFFGRFGLLAVFIGRMTPVVRSYVAYPAGLSRIGLAAFVFATALGSLVWTMVMTFAGFQLGRQYEKIGAFLGPLRLPIAVMVVVLLLVAYYVGRRLGRETEVIEAST